MPVLKTAKEAAGVSNTAEEKHIYKGSFAMQNCSSKEQVVRKHCINSCWNNCESRNVQYNGKQKPAYLKIWVHNIGHFKQANRSEKDSKLDAANWLYYQYGIREMTAFWASFQKCIQLDTPGHNSLRIWGFTNSLRATLGISMSVSLGHGHKGINPQFSI